MMADLPINIPMNDIKKMHDDDNVFTSSDDEVDGEDKLKADLRIKDNFHDVDAHTVSATSGVLLPDNGCRTCIMELTEEDFLPVTIPHRDKEKVHDSLSFTNFVQSNKEHSESVTLTDSSSLRCSTTDDNHSLTSSSLDCLSSGEKDLNNGTTTSTNPNQNPQGNIVSMEIIINKWHEDNNVSKSKKQEGHNEDKMTSNAEGLKEEVKQIQNLISSGKPIPSSVLRRVSAAFDGNSVANKDDVSPTGKMLSKVYDTSIPGRKCMRIILLESEEQASDTTADESLPKRKQHPEGNKQLKCMKCGAIFKQRIHFDQHKKIHMGVKPKPYICSECGEGFSTRNDLYSHLSTHEGLELFPCLKCGMKFLKSVNLRVHMKKHSQSGPSNNQSFQCQECSKSYSSRYLLNQHAKVAHGDQPPLQCIECGKTFQQNKHLVLHHARIHSGERRYRCPQCGKAFFDSSDLSRHRKMHSGVRPHLCQSCGKTFTRKHYLNEHVRSKHLGIQEKAVRLYKPQSGKLVQCQVCGKLLYNKNSLTYHMRTHTGEKPYMCQKCGKTFASKKGHDLHFMMHTGEKKKTLPCPICGKGFSLSRALNEHKRRHNNEKPYVCNTCGTAFAGSSCLKRHMRCHTGERPYVCEKCGRAFGQNCGLRLHMRSHSEERPYKCEKCDVAYKDKRSLSRHVLKLKH